MKRFEPLRHKKWTEFTSPRGEIWSNIYKKTSLLFGFKCKEIKTYHRFRQVEHLFLQTPSVIRLQSFFSWRRGRWTSYQSTSISLNDKQTPHISNIPHEYGKKRLDQWWTNTSPILVTARFLPLIFQCTRCLSGILIVFFFLRLGKCDSLFCEPNTVTYKHTMLHSNLAQGEGGKS